MQGLATGLYALKVDNGAGSSVVNNLVTVTNGNVGNIKIRLSYPSSGVVKVNYTNAGQTDVNAPLFRLSATNAQINYPVETATSPTLRKLLNLTLGTSDNGPAGILAPGESGEFFFNYTPSGNGVIDFNVEQVQPTEVINWNSIKAEARAEYSFIDSDGWDAMWSNLTANVGQTVGQFQTVMAENANYLSQLGQETNDLTRLFAFEWKQSANTLINTSLLSATDVVDAAPGLSLSFSRTFYQSIAERYSLSSLGRGWASQWDVSATTDNQGNVVIRSTGDVQRLFQRQANGTYLGADGTTLTLTNGQYRLREANGIVSVFGTDGKLTSIEDPNGNRITTTYTNNRLTKLLHTNGDSLTLAYNSQGRISQITDSLGEITSYSYDLTGENLLSVTNPEGTTTYTYDASNIAAKKYSLLSVTSDLGYQQSFEYDKHGRVTKQYSNGGANTLTYSYDSTGGVTTTNSTGASQTTLLNNRGDAGQIRGVNNQNQLFRYDADGHLIGATLPNGGQISYSYDAAGNLTQQTNLLGQNVKFTYDATYNQLTGFTDPKSQGVSYSYNPQRNLTKITYADGSTQQFSVDTTGNVTSYINRRGANLQYTYNKDGQLTQKQNPDGSLVTYSYDTMANLTSVTDAAGTIAMQYDTAMRLTNITYPTGRSLSYTYNAAGQRTKLVAQDGYTVNYSYDNVGRLQTLTDGTGNSIISYNYDSAGRLIEETNGNGTYTTYQYDLQSQLTSLTNYKADSTINSKFEYTYDTLGLRTSMTTLEGVFKYGYDAIGQLTSVVTPTSRTISYQYDAAGNRTTVTDNATIATYSSNNLNQYNTVGNTVYAYDTDGNLTNKIEGGQTSTYTYNAENRLTQVVTPQGTWQYEYDSLGNRIATVVNGQRTEYLIDPDGWGNIVGEYNNSGNLVAHYDYGIGLVSRADGSNTNYYDADALGSTVGLTGTTGSYVNSYSYLPFGENVTKVEGVANPFEYVGQWGVTNEANGLDFMRARFYTPSEGRFISSDPINILGGRNFYQYTQNNPVTFVDPFGLSTLGVGGGVGGNGGGFGAGAGGTLTTTLNGTPNLALQASGGGGATAGPGSGGGFGVNVTFTNAKKPSELTGGGAATGFTIGPLSIDYVTDSKNSYDGISVTLSNSPGLNVHVFVTDTVDILSTEDDGPGGGGGGSRPGSGPGGGGGGGGGISPISSGDPHLRTFDGINYEFQAAGEFTLLKSTTDDLEIQTRQSPYGAGLISLNTAVAVKTGGDRIGFYIEENGTKTLKVNGTPISIAQGSLNAVGQNLILRNSSNIYSIISANNDIIQIAFGIIHIDISTSIANNRKGQVIGLAGNKNDNKNDDFALRDGTVIGGSITNEQLYGNYANSWRITQENSLFDYAVGQNTSTFTDLSYPRNIVTSATLTPEQRAAAEQIARNAGITDPSILENAILDIALIDNAAEFIRGYTEQQRQATINAANTLINPDGFGTQHWLNSFAVIPYTINFSNNAVQGTTPVAQVTITQQLDTDLDFNTFSLNNFSFGGITLSVPVGAQNFSQRLDLRSTRGVFVDVNAGLDKVTGIVNWTLTAIDPTTGNPANISTQGFLPPNDQAGAGRGTVGYSIQPKANSANATRLDAQANISFNSQTPIQTNPVFNTLDTLPPISQVTVLPANSGTNFTVAWTGADSGSGIAKYDIYASTNSGQYVLWQNNVATTSAIYNGQVGKSYAFYSVATDNLGQAEAAPTQADATTRIITGSNDFNGDGKSDILWLNDYGSIALWQMNGATVTSGNLTSTPSIDPSWNNTGTGDFNGDGKSDILWRNTSGAVAIWQMDGATVTSSNLTSTPSLDDSWKTAGTGDFNGDGQSDILWRNTNGAVVVWQMDGNTITTSKLTSTPSLDSSWKTAGTSDFDGDGQSDILWRNDDGSVALWQMNGASITASTAVAKVATD